MKGFVTALACCTAILAAGLDAAAQPCGDVDVNSSAPNIGDIATLQSYLFLGLATLTVPANADVDDKWGITIADHSRLVDHVFLTFPPLDCVIDTCYDYGISLADTVILPLATCVDASITTLSLDVETRFSAGVQAFYFPIEPLANGSNSVFLFTNATSTGAVPGTNVGTLPTPRPLLYAAEAVGGPYGGTNIMYRLNYTRNTGGFGTITTGVFDYDFGRRFVIQKLDGLGQRNLYRPVVLYRWQYDRPDGDYDCDCFVTMADLTIMINGLFIDLTWPTPCPLPF